MIRVTGGASRTFRRSEAAEGARARRSSRVCALRSAACTTGVHSGAAAARRAAPRGALRVTQAEALAAARRGAARSARSAQRVRDTVDGSDYSTQRVQRAARVPVPD